VRDPLPDTIKDGQSGLCIEKSDPESLADAIAKLHADRPERDRLGKGARQLAETHFDQARNSLEVLDAYRDVCGWSQGALCGRTVRRCPRKLQTLRAKPSD
jgi:glycosyltransferase involved in cell wall biosynthesis